MEGIRLCDMAALGEFTANGRRVFTKSGVGYFKIEKPVGNVPHDCSLSPPPACATQPIPSLAYTQ